MTTNEIRVAAGDPKGMRVEATASLKRGEKLHVEPSNGGFTFFVSNGGEACSTPEEARDLRRKSR